MYTVLNQGVFSLQLLAFEAYRDLVKLHQGRHTDESGIRAAQEENLNQRASALAAAQVAIGVSHFQAASASAMPALAGALPAEVLMCSLWSICAHVHVGVSACQGISN